MSGSSFQEAGREQNLLRMGLEGLPGAGKTWTALCFAQRLAEHYGGKIAVIDAEHGRSNRYAGMRPSETANPLAFAVSVLTDFSPSNYTAKIEEAGRAGFRVLVIDSFSHEWRGPGGILSLKAAQPAKRAYTGWADLNPLHERVIDAILGSPCHVICTVRAKIKHVLIEGDRGTSTPQRIGVGPIQRPDTEYEFEIYGELDRSHILTIRKSMCPAIDKAIVPCPTGEFMDTVIQWLKTGSAPRLGMCRRLLDEQQLNELIALVSQTNCGMDKLKTQILKRHKVQEIADLMPEQADEEIKRLRALLPKTAAPKSAAETAPKAQTEANGTVPQPRQDAAAESPPARQTASFSRHAVTEEQLQFLAALRKELFAAVMPDASAEIKTEKWMAILAKRKVNTARALTQEQAAELINKLRTQLDVIAMESPETNQNREQPKGGEAAGAANGGDPNQSN